MSNASDSNCRELSDQFIQDLKGGLLSHLLKKVVNDHSLSLEIRNHYINIYYRGGRLLKLSEATKKKHTYKPLFEIKYARDEVEVVTIIKKLPSTISKSSPEDLGRWIDNFSLLKAVMDSWFIDNPKKEREFQQLVVWENNNSSIASATDYFIIDIEYDNRNGGRFDIVAIQWDSDTTARKLQRGYLPKLCFIEMKYGDAALGGDSASDGKSGMVKHAEQWKDYLTSDNIDVIKNEMLTLFKQKRDLGLIAGLKDNSNNVISFSDKIDCIFLLANHDPSSRTLKDNIDKLEDKQDHGLEIKFCVSNFMGYGLFKENVYTIDKFQERYHKQIFNG